MKLATWFF